MPFVVLAVLLIPPFVTNAPTLRATPTASLAEPAYPLNHTFDADIQSVGTPPTNSDFEAAGSSVGTPPTNSNFSSAASDAGVPGNHDFASGATTSWTTTGTVTIQSDATQGNYARLDSSGATITTEAFTVGSTAQVLSFDVGLLNTNSWVVVKVLSGGSYGTSTQVGSYLCSSSCGYWSNEFVDVSSWVSQSIKVKFERGAGAPNTGVDTARAQLIHPNYTLAGQVARRTEAGGNVYAALESATTNTITAAAFTVDATAQFATVKAKGLTTGADQYKVQVLSGATYATVTDVVITTTAGDAAWDTARFNVSTWAGQSIKIKVSRVSGKVGVDDVGLMSMDVPSWEVTKDARPETGGPSGKYVSTDGNLTSQAFTIPSNVQQMTLKYKGVSSGASFYLELLRGGSYSTVTDLAGNVAMDTANWKTLKVSVQPYAGESVKVRVRQFFNRGMFDNPGLMEITVPAWTLNTTDAVDVGEDANGTYVKPTKDRFYIKSVDINPGIIDAASRVDEKYYSISYDIGYKTGALVRVTWYNSTGSNWVVLLESSSTPTGYTTKHFWLADFMGTKGYFLVQVDDSGGKLYSIAENIARQQLQEPFSQKVGFGIDSSTGGFGYVDKDIRLEGRMPLTFTRFYTGQSDRLGTLGYRWSHNYDTRLEILANGDVGVVFGSGGEEFFIWSSGTSTFAAADPRVHNQLVKNANGTYTYKTIITTSYAYDAAGNPSGVTDLGGAALQTGFDASGRLDTVGSSNKSTVNYSYAFTSAGRLSTITDLNNNVMTLAYNGSNQLTSVTDPDSRALTLAYTSGKLTSVTGPASTVVSYAYDANGDLSSVTDPDAGVRTFTYNKHRVSQANDQRGKVIFTNTFDAYHRVTAQTDALSNSIAISYNDPAKGVTKVTDPLSQVATYYYDVAHRTTDKVDPLNRVLSYLFDANGNLQKVIDPVNNQWQFAYDASGGLTNLTDPLGNPVAITYNPQHLPTTITDALGHVTSMTYDSQGNVLTVTNALGQVTTFTYNANGKMLTKTDPLSHTETYTYDAASNLATRTNALGKVWTYAYDGAGRPLSETDPNGNTRTWTYQLGGQIATEINALGQSHTYGYAANGALVVYEDELANQTIWTYDDRGLVVSKTDPASKVTTYTYAADRKLLTETSPLGLATTYGYDSNDRVTSVTDPTSAATTYAYNTAGLLSSMTDPLNRTTSYTYDTAGRHLTTSQANGGVYSKTYDANGNVVLSTDPLGHVTAYLYDVLNRRTRVTDALGNQTNYTYDAAGRTTQVTDALSQSTTYGYDAANRLLSTTDPAGGVNSTTYDNAGRRVGSTDPMARTTSYAYNAANRLTTMTNPAGNATAFAYDAVGRQTSMTAPTGAVTSQAYNSRGLMTSTTNPLGQVTSYAYDNDGRQVSMTDGRGYTTTYGYDGAGRQTTMTDPLSGVVTFTIDAAGQQTAVTNPRAKTTSYTYNSLGNVLTETDPLGNVKSWTYDAAGRTTTYTDGRAIAQAYSYDVIDRMTGVSYPGGTIAYGYDAIGRELTVSDSTGLTSRAYDAASRVLSVTAPQGAVSYAYNAAGQRTGMTLPGSRTASYAYDSAGRLATLTDWNAQATTFGYNADSRRTTIGRPNGVTSTYSYDAAGRNTGITHIKSGVTLQSFTATYDANGNRASVTHAGGTESYTLDALNRLTSVTYPGPTTSYTYDANGNRLTRTTGGVTTNYTYDNADRMTVAGGVSYGYDANGNLTARGSDTFAWDYASRMTGATVSGTASSYAYDGADVRVSKTVGGVGTTYLWDREGGLASLVDNGTSAYLHADGVIGEVTGATRQDLLLDSLGSVRGATNGAGAVISTADYDAFGAVRASTGSAAAFGFTGEQLDTETGFEYLRARYYDVAIGRFPSADTVQPNAPGTQGYNRYAYTANNPTTWVDPSGHSLAGYGNRVGGAIASGGALWLMGAAISGGIMTLVCYLRPECRRIAEAIGGAAQSAWPKVKPLIYPPDWPWEEWVDDCPWCGGEPPVDDPANDPSKDPPPAPAPVPVPSPGIDPPWPTQGPKNRCDGLNSTGSSVWLPDTTLQAVKRKHARDSGGNWSHFQSHSLNDPDEVWRSFLEAISRRTIPGVWMPDSNNARTCVQSVNDPFEASVLIAADPTDRHIVTMFPK
jgi:RHS repeat-associated protein